MHRLKTKKEKELAFDILYNLVDAVLKRTNPCDIRKVWSRGKPILVSCFHYKSELSELNGGIDLLCCGTCWDRKAGQSQLDHETGCKIKCLGCKLWFCEHIKQKRPDLWALLDEAYNLAREFGLRLDTYINKSEAIR